MPLNRDTEAVAQLDAVCDEYERAIRAGKISLDDDPRQLQGWFQRVPPPLQDWLVEELDALRAELGSAESPAKAPPAGVDRESWDAVARCDTFRELSAAAKTSLARSIVIHRYDSGDLLLRAGEQASGLFLITEGTFRVLGGDGQDRYEIDSDGVGSVLGEMSTLTGYPCSADVVATTPTRAMVLPLESFRSLVTMHPELEIALSQLVSDRLGHRNRDALCGKSLGGYRLGRCLGGGAMGVVYTAQEALGGAPRAVKMLRHRFIYDPRVVSRFDQEAELLHRLQHPNVVAFHDHFVAYRTRFIVMELFDGADLRKAIRQHGPIREPIVRRVLGQVAAGLQYAHQRGVLHLDLKPANLLLDQSGRVAIADFGLSRLIESDGGDHDCVGTPVYMPPEQFLMSDVGPHCDWYALGCIAYELLTGKRLFQLGRSSDTEFLDSKLRAPTHDWPPVDASDELCRHLRGALQPIAADRTLDLGQVASWAQPVPELAAAIERR